MAWKDDAPLSDVAKGIFWKEGIYKMNIEFDRDELESFKYGMNMIFGERDKDVVGCVAAILYEDGSIDRRALLTEGDTDWQIKAMDKLIGGCTSGLTYCLSVVPTAIEKLSKKIVEK